MVDLRMGDMVTGYVAGRYGYVIMSLDRPLKGCAHKQDWHSHDPVCTCC
jgi:hypothetical protein